MRTGYTANEYGQLDNFAIEPKIYVDEVHTAGWTEYAEKLNGRFAMFGFVALVAKWRSLFPRMHDRLIRATAPEHVIYLPHSTRTALRNIRRQRVITARSSFSKFALGSGDGHG